MITKKQQKWIDHLSDTDKIKIVPFVVERRDLMKGIYRNIETALSGL